MKEKTFEKSDWYKGNEAFNEYVRYYDNVVDPVIKEKNLIEFVIDLGLPKNQLRNLIRAIKSSIV